MRVADPDYDGKMRAQARYNQRLGVLPGSLNNGFCSGEITEKRGGTAVNAARTSEWFDVSVTVDGKKYA